MTMGASLVLGTAQWGSDYGITNYSGRPSDDALEELVHEVKLAGISRIDTAPRYGDAHSRIRKWAGDFVITSKISGGSNVDVEAQVLNSFEDLGVQSLHCVLIHDWEEIDSAQRVRASKALAKLKKEGLVANVGVSVYEEDGLQTAATLFEDLDVAQVPANALDRRLDGSPLVAHLHQTGTVFQVRSVLLQGLLADRSNHLKSQHPAVRKFQARSHGNPIALALAHVRALPWADEIVVGVSKAEELREIANTWIRTSAELQSPEIGTDDIDLIDPRRWTPQIEG